MGLNYIQEEDVSLSPRQRHSSLEQKLGLAACLEVDYVQKAQFWAWLGAYDVQQPYGEQFPYRLSADIS